MVECTERVYVMNGHRILAGEGHVRGRWPQKGRQQLEVLQAGPSPPPPWPPSPWKGLLLVWALADGLLQVPPYTLDPQVLKAEAPEA